MTVQQWLDSPQDYDAGARIYAELGTNDNLKRLFTRPRTEYLHKKLLEEIRKLAGSIVTDSDSKIQVPGPATEDFIRPSQAPKKPIDLSALPPELQRLNAEKGRLYQQASHTHARFDLLTTDADRLEHARLIVGNFEKIDEIWEKLDHWEQHKEFKPEPKGKIFDVEAARPAELIKYRNNLRSLISKLKKNPARATDLASKQAELATIENKIRAL